MFIGWVGGSRDQRQEVQAMTFSGFPACHSDLQWVLAGEVAGPAQRKTQKETSWDIDVLDRLCVHHDSSPVTLQQQKAWETWALGLYRFGFES